MLDASGDVDLGEGMKKLVLAAAVAAAIPFAGAAAAGRGCLTPADLEAETAIQFQTDVMVASSACRQTTYGQFRYRNKDAIIRYQNAMIAHFRRAGFRRPDKEFETWITHLANEASLKQGNIPIAQFCAQASGILKLASTLDTKGFHDYAVTHATQVDGIAPKCRK
jgi:hypothetical protein